MYIEIPDFSKPSDDCFLTVDKNGKKIKKGDTLVSYNYPLSGGFKKQKRVYSKVEKYENKLVVRIKPSFMLSYYAESYCEIIKDI